MKEWLERVKQLLISSLGEVPTELNELDWKSSLSENKESLTKHISAFANYPNGGFFAFGIRNDGTLIGINREEAEKISAKLASLARDSVEPPVSIDQIILLHNGRNLLIIRIHEASSKPVHIRGKSIEESYIRSGGTTRKASPSDLKNIIINSQPIRWEHLRAGAIVNTTHVITILDYEKIYFLLKRPLPPDISGVLPWMTSEKLIEKVSDNQFFITNLGSITCAKSLNEFAELRRKSVRIIKYSGKNKIKAEREIIIDGGYASSFSTILENVKILLPQSEVIRNSFRVESPVYPEIALRELIANALIHQDFSISGTSVTIEIFSDRLEITNPGNLLPGKTVDRLIGTNPESRNEILASSMRRYGICEERGSGFIKSIEAIELYGLPPVKFQEGDNFFRVILYSPKKFAEMIPLERIEACYQHASIQFLSGSSMTNSTLRERLKVAKSNSAAVSKVIKDSLTAGKIKLVDPDGTSKKFSQYLPYWA